jgi:hypothetical protein
MAIPKGSPNRPIPKIWAWPKHIGLGHNQQMIIAALVLLGAVCFTLVAAYQWTMFAARDWRTPHLEYRASCHPC